MESHFNLKQKQTKKPLEFIAFKIKILHQPFSAIPSCILIEDEILNQGNDPLSGYLITFSAKIRQAHLREELNSLSTVALYIALTC